MLSKFLRGALCALVLAPCSCETAGQQGLREERESRNAELNAYLEQRKQLLETARPEDYGPPPPADYQDRAKALISATLKDPESARYKFDEPRREVLPYTEIKPDKPVLVWLADVYVNAKNSYGGYAGYEHRGFAWQDGALVAVSEPEALPLVNTTIEVWRWLEAPVLPTRLGPNGQTDPGTAK